MFGVWPNSDNEADIPHNLSDKVFPFALMSNPPPKARQSRKDSCYSRDEMKIIGRYQKEYREQTTRELRGNVFKTKILVDLFNYWLQQGRAPATEEDSATQMKVTWNMKSYEDSLPHCRL
jgi:hypothetical protein